MEQTPSKQIRNNAVSAYLLIFISLLFFVNKKNPAINNDFVKSHTKSAFVLHIGLFVSYLIFIFYGLLAGSDIFGIRLNIVIANICMLLCISGIFYGIYTAIEGKKFLIGESIKFKNTKIIDITKDGKFGEKDRLTILFSYIPFIGYILTTKYSNNEEIKNNLKVNLFFSLIITIIFIGGYRNISNILLLAYTIFVAFIGVSLFGNGNLLSINLPDYFLPQKAEKKLKVLYRYLQKYISGNFEDFSSIETKFQEETKTLIEKEKREILQKKELKGPKKLIYVPILNSFYGFFTENSHSYHIRNGLILTIICIICILLAIFKIISTPFFLLFLFPITFGIGNLYKRYYKMPFIYGIYDFFQQFKTKGKKLKKDIEVKKNTVKELQLKVEDSSKKTEEK